MSCSGGLTPPAPAAPTNQGQTGSQNPVGVPVIKSFTSSGSVAAGQLASLAWQVTGATSVEIDKGIGTLTSSTTTFTAVATTTYTLTATNSLGSSQATCTLTVYPADAGTVNVIDTIPDTGGVNGSQGEARFVSPAGLALDGSGDLFVADFGDRAIRKVSPQGVVMTVLDGLASGTKALAAGPSGVLYFPMGSTIQQFSPTGGLTLLAGSADQTGSSDGTGSNALFNNPTGIAMDAGGTLYVSDSGNNTIRKITSDGTVTTLAGTAGTTGDADGLGPAAEFNNPGALAVDASGNVIVADMGNGRRRFVTPEGTVTTNYGPPLGTGGLAVGADGTVYVGGNDAIYILPPSGDSVVVGGLEGYVNGPVASAQFSALGGLAVDASGNLFVSDTGNNVIRMVTPVGEVSTYAGSNQPTVANEPLGASGLAVDAAGDVFVAVGSSNTIQKVTASGTVSPFAGTSGQAGTTDGPLGQALFGSPFGVALDGQGYLYVTDMGNQTIRKISPEGDVITLAGMNGQAGSEDGTGLAAQFNGPAGIAVDGTGTIYVADSSNHTIRKITPAGVVTTLAGSPGQNGSADGTGAAAQFNQPHGITVDAQGDVLVADTSNGAIRRITPEGVVTTLVFTLGSEGSAGASSEGPLLNHPLGVAVDAAGDIFAFDANGNTILRITPAGVASWVPVNGAAGAALKVDCIAASGGKLYAGSFGTTASEVVVINGAY